MGVVKEWPFSLCYCYRPGKIFDFLNLSDITLISMNLLKREMTEGMCRAKLVSRLKREWPRREGQKGTSGTQLRKGATREIIEKEKFPQRSVNKRMVLLEKWQAESKRARQSGKGIDWVRQGRDIVLGCRPGKGVINFMETLWVESRAATVLVLQRLSAEWFWSGPLMWDSFLSWNTQLWLYS